MFSERIQTVIDRVDRLRDQVDDHWQIPADEARVLAQLISIGRCVSICEIGTSYGFSTLHLAAAAHRHGGHVHTIDQDPKKVAAASLNLRDAGLDDFVTMHQGDARPVLVSIQPKTPFDFVFIDATKGQKRRVPRRGFAQTGASVHPGDRQYHNPRRRAGGVREASALLAGIHQLCRNGGQRLRAECEDAAMTIPRPRVPIRFESVEKMLNGHDLKSLIVPVEEGLRKFDHLHDEMASSLSGAFLILRGETGSGKTTLAPHGGTLPEGGPDGLGQARRTDQGRTSGSGALRGTNEGRRHREPGSPGRHVRRRDRVGDPGDQCLRQVNRG